MYDMSKKLEWLSYPWYHSTGNRPTRLCIFWWVYGDVQAKNQEPRPRGLPVTLRVGFAPPQPAAAGRRPGRSWSGSCRGIPNTINLFFSTFHMHRISVIWRVDNIWMLVNNWFYIIVTMDFDLSIEYVHLRVIFVLAYTQHSWKMN
jgi:hypothetical protein